MPAAPKVSSPRKSTGAPKTKGAVRAKSGCYTCRIRRKKCDETPDDLGRCSTCVRLRVECLGFGTKRPDWLRETRNVVDLRDKIKSFLAAQGMIKGHSGSGPRSADQELPILRLTESFSPSSSESPPTPTLSLSNSDDLHHHHHHTSAMRDQAWMSPVDQPYSQSGLHQPQLRPESPYGGSSHSSYDQLYPTSLPHNSSSTSLGPYFPALASRLSPAYNTLYEDDQDCYSFNNDVQDSLTNVTNILYGQHPYLMPCGPVDQLVVHYVETVVRMQYLLAGPNIRNMLSESVYAPGFSREAARLLAHVHMSRRHSAPSLPALEQDTTKSRYSEMELMLSRHQYSSDDGVIAALNVISSFLFDGGTGPWKTWLGVANTSADGVLRNRKFHGARDALMRCEEQTSFLIRAAMWFDVLASITTQEEPHFLSVFREVFSPYAISDSGNTSRLSMKSVMGCDNHVVWAMAETSALSVWKRKEISRGSLSIPNLVEKGQQIEKHLLTFSNSPPPADDIDYLRQLTSDIFRAATLVYLRSVVSGDHPHVVEIKNAIKETINCIEKIPTGLRDIPDTVIRSTVFAFFICGCLTDSEEQKNYIYTRLDLVKASGSTVGNGGSVQQLIQRVWLERQHKSIGDPVPWRDKLSNASLLLV